MIKKYTFAELEAAAERVHNMLLAYGREMGRSITAEADKPYAEVDELHKDLCRRHVCAVLDLRAEDL